MAYPDDLYLALAGYNQRQAQMDPFSLGGQAILNSPTPQGKGFLDSFAFGALKGGLGGLSSGVGQGRQEEMGNSRYNQLAQAMVAEDPYSAISGNDEISFLAPLFQIEEMKRQRELQNQMFELNQSLMKNGIQLTDSGVQTVPGFAEAQGSIEGAKEKAKYEAQAPEREQKQQIDIAKSETDLRKEIAGSDEYKNYSTVLPIYKSLTERKYADTPADDLAFVYGIGKILDPGSVVREGEIRLAGGAQSPLAQFQGELNKLAGGSKLSPETRGKMLDMLRARVGALQTQYRNVLDPRLRIAERQGLNVNNVRVLSGDDPILQSRPQGGPPPPMPGETKESYIRRLSVR